MSTDIYMYAEKRVATLWQLAEEPELHVETALGMEIGQWYEPRTLYFESGRRLLFNVFARPEWCPAPLRSFGAPRGLPPDASPILRAQAERAMDWSYDHSWLSLAELIAFDWYGLNVPVYGRARAEYADLFDRNKGFPGGVPNGEWARGDIGRLDEARSSMDPGWVPVCWMGNLDELVGSDFLDTVFPALMGFGAPEDVRVVFWFG